MSKTLFDTAVRAVECPNCGGPVESSDRGGRVKCRFCAVEVVVRLRAKDSYGHDRLSQQEDVARLSRLMAQVAHPVHGHAYDLEHTPPDLVGVGEAQMAAMWSRAKAGVDTSTDAQHRLCFLAHSLSTYYVASDLTLRARAVLETAVDLLADSGHRHIVRCRLASLAARHGDLESATEWLSECDEASEVLELDGEYRLAAARVAIERRDPAQALRLLGETEGRVPVDSSHKKSFEAHRIAARELAGNLAGAISSCEVAEKLHGGHAFWKYLEGNRLASQTVAARKEAERQRKEAREKQKLHDAAQAKVAARRFRMGCSMFLLLLAGASALGYYAWINRPFPLSCDNGGSLTIDGRSAKLDGTLIRVGPSCVLTIRNATLSGDRIIEADPGARIEIKDSVLEAKGTAIVLTSGVDVKIEGGSITATTAVRGGYGNKLSLQDVAIETTEEAIELEYDGGISISEGTKIVAGGKKGARAITAKYSLDLRVRDAEIVGSKIVDATYSAKLDVAQSKFVSKGTSPAFTFDYGVEAKFEGTSVDAKGPLLVGGWRSKVSLDGLKFTGGNATSWAVDVTYDADVKLVQSSFKSEGGGIRTHWGSAISLEKDTKLGVAFAGIETGYDTTIRVDKSQIKTTHTAVRAERDSKVFLANGASIDAGIGVHLDANTEINVGKSSITAVGSAIIVANGSSVILNGATINSKDVAVRREGECNFLNTNSTIVGRVDGGDKPTRR